MLIAVSFIALALVLGWLVRPNDDDSPDAGVTTARPQRPRTATAAPTGRATTPRPTIPQIGRSGRRKTLATTPRCAPPLSVA